MDTTIPEDTTSTQTNYRSYLLRLWKKEQSGISDWRASLEDSHTGERFGFANLEQLFAFLLERIEGAGRHPDERSPKP